MDSFNDVFQEVLKYCRNCKSISEPGYNKWIKILEPMKLENNVAYLLTDSDFSRDITMNAYENLLKEAFLNTLGFEVDIKILVKDKEEVNETIETFEDAKDYCQKYFKKDDIKRFNEVVNSIRICDPAVGSGHFLVSALNEMVAIKSELGILADENYNILID